MLADYEIPRRSVMSKDKEIFKVRGLNLEDLTFLAENHLGDIRAAIEAYGRENRRVVERQGLNEFVLLAAKQFPGLVAEIISRAADEPGEAAKARELPWVIQLVALKEIVVLSTEEAGGLKNLMAALATALEIDQQKLGSVQTYLRTIIGGLEKTSASFSATDTAGPTSIP